MFGLTPWLRRLGIHIELWPLLGGACGVVYLASLAADTSAIGAGGGLFGILSPGSYALLAFGASGPVPVLAMGRWWTLLSAGWLHGSLLHIGLNLYGLYQLLPAVEELYGKGRTLVIYTLSSVVGFAFSSFSPFAPGILRMVLGGGRMSVGASASLLGLLGALVHYSRRTGRRGMGQQVWAWVIATFVYGLMPGLNLDNWAHLGGFLGGWLLSFLLDPLREERTDHLVVGILCVLASGAAIAWSLVTAWRG
jgi:rhomboid protease GluP